MEVENMTDGVTTPEDQPVPISTILVNNIVAGTTKEQLVTLFGLAATPFLKKNTKIDIGNEDAGSFTATISVPTGVADVLLKLDGHQYEGQKLGITDAAAQEVEEISHMEIDTRLPKWSANNVRRMEVIRALEVNHSDDVTKSVEPMRNNLLGIFRIDSSDYGRYLNQTIVVRGEELQLVPRINRRDRQGRRFPDNRKDNRREPQEREGTYVTIYSAFRIHHRNIPHEKFTQYFMNMEDIEVCVQTQPQKTRGTNTLTNHRWLVLKTKGESKLITDIGSEIVIEDQSFNLMYDGMQKWCGLCSAKHGKTCISRARFEILKQARYGLTDKRKIYSDSHLRQVNQLALTTDVTCMSGGGLAQLCNMVPYDNKHEEVILSGGSNEILRSESREEFIYTVEKTEEKLRKLAQDRKVTVVIPKPPTFGPEEDGKQRFYEQKLKTIDCITLIDLKDIEFDETSHPTEGGTKEFVVQIEEAIGDQIILNEAEGEITAKRKYSQVSVTYKVGCRGCDTPHFTPSLCRDCIEKSKTVNVQELNDIIETIREQMYPDLITDPTLGSKTTASKRVRENDISDDENRITKNKKNDGDS